MGICRVTFKSGATIEFDADSITWTEQENPLGLGDYRKLTWEGQGQRKLMTINLDAIDAIVFDQGEK